MTVTEEDVRTDGHQEVEPSRLLPRDVLRVGGSGLRARKLRTSLSALGVSIGIAAMVGVLGLSDSSRADLLAELTALGTNLLTIQPGEGFGTGDAELPDDSTGRIGRLDTVEQVSATSTVDATVRRTSYIDEGETGGLRVVAADPDLLDTLAGEVAQGTFLTPASQQYPAAVLGSVAAERLGIDQVSDEVSVTIGDTSVPVVGILEPFPLAGDLDRAVIVGTGAAGTYLDDDLTLSTVYVRVDEDLVAETRDLLPATTDPRNPEEVEVSRPSDVLEAQVAAESAFSSLFLGLGAVALLVGGIGIANVMVIAVIERRSEIGLRRALGATEGHVRSQFLTEALLLSGLGGSAGVALGIAVTAAYALSQGWRIVIPPEAVAGGLLAALVIGAVAGIYPAIRAARLAPTEALRSQ